MRSADPFSSRFEVFGRAPASLLETLNQAALERLKRMLDLGQGGDGRVILVRAPRAGFGKTSLLQRLASEFADTHQFVRVNLVGGRTTDAAHVLEYVLQALCRVLPDSNTLTELDLLARKILAVGLEPLVSSGEVPCQDRDGALQALREQPVETFDFHHDRAVTAHWTKSNFEILGPRMAAELARLSGASLRESSYWVELLFRFATTAPDNVERARLLFETVFRSDLKNQSESGAEERLHGLLALLGAVTRVVLIVDDTEGLSTHPPDALELAAFLANVSQCCPGTLVVLSVNSDVWETAFLPLLPGGLADRLTEHVVSLEPLTDEEARELIRSRAGERADEVLTKMNWPDGDLFARQVLKAASAAWEMLEESAPSELKGEGKGSVGLEKTRHVSLADDFPEDLEDFEDDEFPAPSPEAEGDLEEVLEDAVAEVEAAGPEPVGTGEGEDAPVEDTPSPFAEPAAGTGVVGANPFKAVTPSNEGEPPAEEPESSLESPEPSPPPAAGSPGAFEAKDDPFKPVGSPISAPPEPSPFAAAIANAEVGTAGDGVEKVPPADEAETLPDQIGEGSAAAKSPLEDAGFTATSSRDDSTDEEAPATDGPFAAKGITGTDTAVTEAVGSAAEPPAPASPAESFNPFAAVPPSLPDSPAPTAGELASEPVAAQSPFSSAPANDLEKADQPLESPFAAKSPDPTEPVQSAFSQSAQEGSSAGAGEGAESVAEAAERSPVPAETSPWTAEVKSPFAAEQDDKADTPGTEQPAAAASPFAPSSAEAAPVDEKEEASAEVNPGSSAPEPEDEPVSPFKGLSGTPASEEEGKEVSSIFDPIKPESQFTIDPSKLKPLLDRADLGAATEEPAAPSEPSPASEADSPFKPVSARPEDSPFAAIGASAGDGDESPGSERPFNPFAPSSTSLAEAKAAPDEKPEQVSAKEEASESPFAPKPASSPFSAPAAPSSRSISPESDPTGGSPFKSVDQAGPAGPVALSPFSANAPQGAESAGLPRADLPPKRVAPTPTVGDKQASPFEAGAAPTQADSSEGAKQVAGNPSSKEGESPADDSSPFAAVGSGPITPPESDSEPEIDDPGSTFIPAAKGPSDQEKIDELLRQFKARYTGD